MGGYSERERKIVKEEEGRRKDVKANSKDIFLCIVTVHHILYSPDIIMFLIRACCAGVGPMNLSEGSLSPGRGYDEHILLHNN